jgi:hypothetical protein
MGFTASVIPLSSLARKSIPLGPTLTRSALSRELLITLLSLSQFPHHMETSILESEYNYKQPDALHRSFIDQGVQQPSSFVATLPNAHT